MNNKSNKMNNCVFIGIDLGASLKRKSTGLACIVDKNGLPYMESPPVHIKSDDESIRSKYWAETELTASVIEVYPYAARVALHIGIGVKKKSKQGRKIIQDGLLTSIKGLNEIIGDKILSIDELDAILSAYTAYLKEKGNITKKDGVDGAIYLPLKKWDHEINEY